MDRQVVLFVCSGNTCRSVMAEGLFTKIWESSKKKEKNVRACSAGMETVDGLSATGEALQVLRDEGIDLSSHSSRRVNSPLVEEADYIFTMTMWQKELLLERFPRARHKVWQLTEFAGGAVKDISDPIGQGLERYRLTAEEIKAALVEIVNKLQAK